VAGKSDIQSATQRRAVHGLAMVANKQGDVEAAKQLYKRLLDDVAPPQPQAHPLSAFEHILGACPCSKSHADCMHARKNFIF